MIRWLLFSSAALLAMAAMSRGQAAPAQAPGWDNAAAARYLESRLTGGGNGPNPNGIMARAAYHVIPRCRMFWRCPLCAHNLANIDKASMKWPCSMTW